MGNIIRWWGVGTVLVAAGCAGSEAGQTSGAATLGSEEGSSSTTAVAESSEGPTTSSSDPSATSTPGDGSTSSLGTTTGSADASTTAVAGSCPDDPAACTAWILPPMDTQWEPLALDADSELAPNEPIRAAFGVDSANEGYVLTDTRVHVVDLVTRRWDRFEARENPFPQVEGVALTSAFSVPAFHSAEGDQGTVTLLSEGVAYVYGLDAPTGTLTFSDARPDFDADWNDAPAPATAQIRATFLDIMNAHEWFDADLQALCESDVVPTAPGPYTAIVTGDAVHVQDSGYCFRFVAPQPYAQFQPMAHDGAPPADRVGASLYSEVAGLWVFAGPD